jgi:hypothetical protein
MRRKNFLLTITIIIFTLLGCQSEIPFSVNHEDRIKEIQNLEVTAQLSDNPTPEPSDTFFYNPSPTSTPSPISTTPISATKIASTIVPSITPSIYPLAPGENIIANHQAADGFFYLDDESIKVASELKFMFRHSSIGVNLSQGLDCLANNFQERRPNHCPRFYDTKYDRSNWDFQVRPNEGWIEKVNDFVRETHAQAGNYDAFSFLVDYADGLDHTTYPQISDLENFQKEYIQKLEELEAQYPDKLFIWWTMSLARVNHDNGQKFNEMLRDYTATNDKLLFDLADIMSHDPNGVKHVDEHGREILYEGYTDEVVGGHLNPEGRERAAKALWWMMVRISSLVDR